MRHTLFAVLLLLGTLTAVAAQSDAPMPVVAPWLDILLERGLAVVLVIGGSWFIAFKVWPKLSSTSDAMVAAIQSIDKKLDALAARLSDVLHKDGG